MTMNAVELASKNQGPVEPAGVTWFEQTMREAEMMAATELVPAAFRGRPADIVVAAMYGRDLGWSPTIAVNNVIVVDGKPTLTAQAMVALVRRAGHSLTGKKSSTGATVTGRRADNGDEMTVEFTVWDAARAGLCTVDSDGVTRARSSKGKRLPWEMYPMDMCWARAVSSLCRSLFPDVMLGVSYVPDELDGLPDASFAADDLQQPGPNLRKMRDIVRDNLEKLNRNHHEAWEAWKAEQPEGWELTDPDRLQEAIDLTNEMLRSQGADPFLDDGGVVDAEIVDDDGSDEAIGDDAASETVPEPGDFPPVAQGSGTTTLGDNPTIAGVKKWAAARGIDLPPAAEKTNWSRTDWQNWAYETELELTKEPAS